MKLLNGVIRPGTVLEVMDDGCIKAAAPGLFSIEDDVEKLPKIIPFFIGGNANSYSKPLLNDEVWIMNFNDNPQQLYWFRKDYPSETDNMTNIIKDQENVEILCNREVGAGWCALYFSDGSGWVISKDESTIQIQKNGSIVLNTGKPNRCIDINGKNISIGSIGKSAHPAAYGDTVEEILLSLCLMLNQVAMGAMANPYTINIGTTILQKLPGIINDLSSISSDHVTID